MSADEVLDPAVLDSLRALTAPGEDDVLIQVLTLFLAEVPPRVQRVAGAGPLVDRLEAEYARVDAAIRRMLQSG